jgi:hypothetical protein
VQPVSLESSASPKATTNAQDPTQQMQTSPGVPTSWLLGSPSASSVRVEQRRAKLPMAVPTATSRCAHKGWRARRPASISRRSRFTAQTMQTRAFGSALLAAQHGDMSEHGDRAAGR